MITQENGLEISEKQMRSMSRQALDQLMFHWKTMSGLPLKGHYNSKAIKKLIREPIPTRAQSFEKLLKIIFDDLLPASVQVPSPGYLAYIPVGSVYPAVVAEWITYGINRWAGLYDFAPGFIEIENVVVRWLCDMMGLPKGSGGVLTSGGSLANLSAIVTARNSVLGEDFFKGTVYFCEHAHHSIEKSARIVGVPKSQLRSIPGNDLHQMSVSGLKKAIHQDLKNGFKPFMVVANAGSTGTGAIDALAKISQICKRYRIWFHVDAAWAGSLRMTLQGSKRLRDTRLADSITIDPHKALYTPFGCGALLVRDPKKLRDAHTFDAAYLPKEKEEEMLLSPSQLSPELSRGLRGLQVWVPLKFFGVTPFKKALEEKLKLVSWLTSELKKLKGIEITFEPQTVIVGFRYFDPKRSLQELNLLNKRFLDRINSDGRIILSGIELGGVFSIRVIPFGQRTHFKEVELTKKLIKNALADL